MQWLEIVPWESKKDIGENQYPEPFYEPIISEIRTKIIQKENVHENEESVLNLSDISSSVETESVKQNNDIDLNEAIHSIEDISPLPISYL